MKLHASRKQGLLAHEMLRQLGRMCAIASLGEQRGVLRSFEEKRWLHLLMVGSKNRYDLHATCGSARKAFDPSL
jgi:hypothetical protein